MADKLLIFSGDFRCFFENDWLIHSEKFDMNGQCVLLKFKHIVIMLLNYLHSRTKMLIICATI